MRSTERISRILEATAKSQSISITEISAAVGIDKSSVWRIVNSLAEEKLMNMDPISGKYTLGPLIYKLAMNTYDNQSSLVDASRKPMVYLRDTLGETVTLNIRRSTFRICLWEVVSSQKIMFSAGIGNVEPLYVGASGKILLAWLSRDELEAILSSIVLNPVTSETITDKEKLISNLGEIKASGFATSTSERVQGSTSISVPIFLDKKVLASLSIIAPAFRLPDEKKLECLPLLRDEAKKISSSLG